MEEKKHTSKLKAGAILVAMGIVYGDIGTSPLYVMKAIVAGNGGMDHISPEFMIGSVSLIFWTLTILTTVKYVLVALNADNHGEGGIFSLYTLVRKNSKYLIIPAMIGGAALLADGVLTPAVTVTTAIEGLRDLPAFYTRFGEDQNIIVIITLSILLILFGLQRFGTDVVGRAFGPIMFLWFTFIGIIGLLNFSRDWSVIQALNPVHAFRLLISPENKQGLFILGSVFLATTGAEALYSDLGHVGKASIRISWPYIKLCLVLNYFGQAAWVIQVGRNSAFAGDKINPFFSIIPENITLLGIVFATLASVIASQALISGSYTLVSEAIKLNLLPRLKIIYPSTHKGQLYIPSVNLLLWILCSLLVIYFRTSARMEAAYGLSITITMLMTTLLLVFYLKDKFKWKPFAYLLCLFFAFIESVFFISSAAKFFHGGYVAVMLAVAILFLMVIWERGKIIEDRETKEVHVSDYMEQLDALRKDPSLPVYQTNLIFMTSRLTDDKVAESIMYSILDKRPKRAKVYWFVTVDVTDEPYTQEYEVDMMGTDYLVKVRLRLGFRVPQEINVYIRQIVHDLMKQGKLPKQPQRYSVTPNREVGDFRFIFIREELPSDNELSFMDRFVIHTKLRVKKIVVSPARWFGLEFSDVDYEYVPMIIGKAKKTHLTGIVNE